MEVDEYRSDNPVYDKRIECIECNGYKETHYSCCGDDVYGTEWEDIDLCPTCREHLLGRETCERCEGTGWEPEYEKEYVKPQEE